MSPRKPEAERAWNLIGRGFTVCAFLVVAVAVIALIAGNWTWTPAAASAASGQAEFASPAEALAVDLGLIEMRIADLAGDARELRQRLDQLIADRAGSGISPVEPGAGERDLPINPTAEPRLFVDVRILTGRAPARSARPQARADRP